MAPESDFSVRTLFRPLFKPSLPTVDSRLNSSDAFKRALLQMLQEQHAAFTRAQAKRQNEFDEALQTKKEMMNIRDMEDGRRFLLVQKTYREAARAWELEFLSAFTKQETERMKQFTEAEKAREQKFLEAAEENEKEFKTLATCENQFYKLMADLEKKTYENEASRTQNMFNWGHVQRREVKSTVEMWKKKFAAEEETRQYAFSILLAEFRLRQ